MNKMKKMERVKGIEPSYSAWKAAALPLSYTRITQDTTLLPSESKEVVGEAGLEPAKA